MTTAETFDNLCLEIEQNYAEAEAERQKEITELYSFISHLRNAKANGLQLEWFQWFISEIRGGATVPAAAWSASCEWDL